MSREQNPSCPECKSENTERKGRMIDGAPVSILHCYHCNGDFRKTVQLKTVKTFPGYESTGNTWDRA